MSGLLIALGNFALYFLLAVVLLLVFKWLYTWVTPHDEWQLIKNEQNMAAAIGFSGAIIGFALALASAAAHSVSLLDFAVWGGVGLLAQLLAFLLVRFLVMPKLIEKIKANDMAAGSVLGATSVAVGLLNAACMTY